MKTTIAPLCLLLCCALMFAASPSPCAPQTNRRIPPWKSSATRPSFTPPRPSPRKHDELADLLQAGGPARFPLCDSRPAPGICREPRIGILPKSRAWAGGRLFNVEINGKTVLTGFDIARTAGGPLKPVVRRYTVTPKRGYIDIHFTATPGQRGDRFHPRARTPTQAFVISPKAARGRRQRCPCAMEPRARARYTRTRCTGRRELRHAAGRIGTGKFEILSNGSFANLTTGNGWDMPVPEAPGTFIAVAAKSRSGSGTARVLRVRDRRGRAMGIRGRKDDARHPVSVRSSPWPSGSFRTTHFPCR